MLWRVEGPLAEVEFLELGDLPAQVGFNTLQKNKTLTYQIRATFYLELFFTAYFLRNETSQPKNCKSTCQERARLQRCVAAVPGVAAPGSEARVWQTPRSETNNLCQNVML